MSLGGEPQLDYIRRIDFTAIDKSGPDERLIQELYDHTSGAKNCSIKCIKTPVDSGSPGGLHTHAVDQIFYVLKGTMSIEVEGKEYNCTPGTLIIFPAGVPHRNWNEGSEPTIHLAFNTPLPDPELPFSQPT